MPLSKDIPFLPSPNFSSRGSAEVIGTVVHYTGGWSTGGSIKWLMDKAAKASAHFVIARDGEITQLVELHVAAWHAGVGEMPHGGEVLSNPNQCTIGIELSNCGLLQKHGEDFFYEVGRTLKRYEGEAPQFRALVYDNGLRVEGWWEPFWDEQLDALQGLLRQLAEAGFREAVSNLVGHEEIAMPLGRKTDPGPCFPWDRFSRKAARRTLRG